MGIAARLAGVKIDYETEVVGYVDLNQPAALLASGELREADVRSVRLPERASLPGARIRLTCHSLRSYRSSSYATESTRLRVAYSTTTKSAGAPVNLSTEL